MHAFAVQEKVLNFIKEKKLAEMEAEAEQQMKVGWQGVEGAAGALRISNLYNIMDRYEWALLMHAANCGLLSWHMNL